MTTTTDKAVIESGFLARRNAPRLAAIAISAVASVSAVQSGAAQSAFDQSFSLQGVTFRVQCDKSGSENALIVTPDGLELDNSPVTAQIDGTVTGAEIADLNADGSPEIYVYVTSAGSGSYGSLAAWAANSKNSLSPIYLPDIADDPKFGSGYIGHDEFAIIELYFARHFPIYREGDTNAEPTGGTRQVLYKLEPGEASWQLVAQRDYLFD